MRMTAVAEPEAVVASLVAAPALLMSFDSGIQAVRDSVQGTFQSFLFSLPLKVALSLAGAAISGSLLAPFKDAIRAGERKRALEGDDFDWKEVSASEREALDKSFKDSTEKMGRTASANSSGNSKFSPGTSLEPAAIK